MSNNKAAKDLYKEICSIAGLKLGPFLLLDESKRRKADDLRSLIPNIFSEIEHVGERLVRAPSPWHAALMMMATIEYSTTHNEEPIEEKGKIAILTSQQRPLFRGQGDATWHLIAKKDRPYIDKVFENRAVESICALLARLFRSADLPTPPAQAYVAIAQHYGLATHLLDFTCDPLVAVYFAAHGNKARHDQEAVVFLLPLIDALNHGAKIILPPPFAKRLYIQKGVFVEAPEQTAISIRDLCWEIRFPLDSSFEVIRENGHVNLLPADPWLEKAVQWARNWAKAGKDFPTESEVAEPIFYTACQEIGYPTHLDRVNAMEQIAMWVNYTSDIFYWLAIIVNGDNEWIDPIVVDAIVRDNSVLMEIVANMFAADSVRLNRQGQGDLASGRNQLSQIIHDALNKMRSVT